MRIRTMAIAGLAGAAVAYLFDPIAGSARRSRIREQLAAFTRRRMPEGMPSPPVHTIPAMEDEGADAVTIRLPESQTMSRPVAPDLGDAWSG